MNDPNSHISRIDTLWTMVHQAHREEKDAAAAAQEVLLRRYSGAIYHYLLAALRDPHAADEVFQEFALRFVRGLFKNADPERGRFRDFVKKSLFNLVVDHRKKQGKQPGHLASGQGFEPAAAEESTRADDQEFAQRWRDELLAKTWDALAEIEAKTNQPYHAVLQYRAHHPEANSIEMAKQLSARLNKPFTDAGIRQILHRAREKFADLLLDEVERSLQSSDADRLEQELIDLGLQSYCRSALQKRGKRD